MLFVRTLIYRGVVDCVTWADLGCHRWTIQISQTIPIYLKIQEEKNTISISVENNEVKKIQDAKENFESWKKRKQKNEARKKFKSFLNEKKKQYQNVMLWNFVINQTMQILQFYINTNVESIKYKFRYWIKEIQYSNWIHAGENQ